MQIARSLADIHRIDQEAAQLAQQFPARLVREWR
jgi:hypothetical protein